MFNDMLHVPLCHLAWNFCTLPSSGDATKLKKTSFKPGPTTTKRAGKNGQKPFKHDFNGSKRVVEGGYQGG